MGIRLALDIYLAGIIAKAKTRIADSSGVTAHDQGRDSSDQYLCIQGERQIFNVEEIVGQFGARLCKIRRVIAPHLSPAGNAWPNQIPIGEGWQVPCVDLAEERLFRPRADNAHIPLKNIPELR